MINLLKFIGKEAKTNTQLGNGEEEIAEALKKSPEQVISENLKLLIGENPTRTLSEEQRKKYRNKYEVVTKSVGDQEVDYISPKIYLKLVDKKLLKQNYKYFEKIVRASGGIKDGKQQSEVNDGGIIYRKLEAMNIPKGFMRTCANCDKIIRGESFIIPIYNPDTQNLEHFLVNHKGYQLTMGFFPYHICIGLPSHQED